jgi:hypothetical protein
LGKISRKKPNSENFENFLILAEKVTPRFKFKGEVIYSIEKVVVVSIQTAKKSQYFSEIYNKVKSPYKF